MKKLILLIALTLPLMGQAQPPEGKDWWACQTVQSVGASWNGATWEPARFSIDGAKHRFILIAGDEGLTKESVAKALESRNPDDLLCSTYGAQHYCFSKLTGESFGFSTLWGTGAIGSIFGGVLQFEGLRDDVLVSPFECAKG